MTTHTTLSAATQAGQKDRPSAAGMLQTHTPPPIATFLIANLELKLIVSHRKTSSLKIPNRKKIRVLRPSEWHRHSCLPRGTKGLPRGTKGLCVFARPRIRPAKAVTSLQSTFRILIETPRLEFPATTTKLNPLPISNRDNLTTFIVVALSLAPQPNHLFRRPAEPKDCPSPALRARITSHDSQITSHEFLSTRPITFSPSTPVLDFAQQFCSEENFSATTANRWNFGLCATIPREPRQARKGATVTGQLRVPRNTRSSSLARPLLKIAADFSRLRINGVPKTVRINVSPAPRYDGSRVTSHKLRVTDSR